MIMLIIMIMYEMLYREYKYIFVSATYLIRRKLITPKGANTRLDTACANTNKEQTNDGAQPASQHD